MLGGGGSITSGITQSVPICIALSAVGGILEVFATALLAYVDVKSKSGQTFSICHERSALAGNISLQILASVVGNLFAPWFGPVSLVGPFFLSAQLVANMIVFGFFLGIESFPKDMKVGTYVIVVSAAILTEVGPTAQNDQDVMELLSNWYSLLWAGVILAGMLFSSAFLPLVHKRKLGGREGIKFIILLVARSSAFTVNLTVSKMMVGNPNLISLVVSIILKILSGATMTFAIVVQSTAVMQAKFVPLNASCIIFVNAVTGIIIWEDWRVVQSWLGYVGIFLLILLGNFLMLGEGALFEPENERYGRAAVLHEIVHPHHPHHPHHHTTDVEPTANSEEDREGSVVAEESSAAAEATVISSTSNGHTGEKVFVDEENADGGIELCDKMSTDAEADADADANAEPALTGLEMPRLSPGPRRRGSHSSASSSLSSSRPHRILGSSASSGGSGGSFTGLLPRPPRLGLGHYAAGATGRTQTTGCVMGGGRGGRPGLLTRPRPTALHHNQRSHTTTGHPTSEIVHAPRYGEGAHSPDGNGRSERDIWAEALGIHTDPYHHRRHIFRLDSIIEVSGSDLGSEGRRNSHGRALSPLSASDSWRTASER